MPLPCTPALISLACGGLGVALFWSSTRCGFCLDDHLAIEDNADVSSALGGAAFWHDFWGRDMNAENSHKSWRPLTIISFQLNYLAGGLEPWGYHAANAVLHGGVCAAVAHLAWIVSARCVPTSLVAGMSFAAHPVHVEAVTGVVGRADELGTLFSLLAFFAYVRLLRACSVLRRADDEEPRALSQQSSPNHRVDVDGVFVSAGLFLVCAWSAMLSKEVAVTLLGIVAVYDLALQPWLGVWLPLPVGRRQQADKTAKKQQRSTLRVPVCALVLRWLLVAFCGFSYLGLRAWLTADSGKATLEGSQLLRRAENPFARPFTESSWSYAASLLYLQAFYAKLLLSVSGELCCEYSYNCIPTVNSYADPRNLSTLSFWVGLGWLVRWAVLRHASCWQARTGCSETGTLRAANAGLQTSVTKTAAGDAGGMEQLHEDDRFTDECTKGTDATVDDAEKERDKLANDVDHAQPDLHGAYPLCALSWLVLPMLPASNLLFTVGTLVAERLLYMPSIGFVLLFAHAMIAATKRCKPAGQVAVWSAFAVLLAVSCQRTVSRTEDWLDDEALYSSAVQVCPNSAKNHHQLGQIYMNQAADIAMSFDNGGNGAEDISELTAKALRQFEAVQAIDPSFCDVEYNLGQHHIAVCQNLVITAVAAVTNGAARSSSRGPLRLSDCAGLSVGLQYLHQNLDCVFTNMKSYPLLMQVYNIIMEEQPTNSTVWGQIAEISEQIGDDDAAATQYSSQGHAILKYSPSVERGVVDATAAFKRAVELAPDTCEYGYWLADAMHSKWSAMQRLDAKSSGKSRTKAKKTSKTQPGSDNSLSGLREACHQLEETLDCVSSYRELHGNQPYPAQLDSQKNAAPTAITEGNFVPTLLEWLNEGVQIALESQEDEGEVNVGAAAAARAAEFYEGSARALRRLQPAEAEAGGLDVGNVAANYMLQAAVGYASGENMLSAAQALVQVVASDANSGVQADYTVVLDLGCDAVVQFLTVGLAVLQSELLTRPVMHAAFSGNSWREFEARQATLYEAVENAVLALAASARRCPLGAALEQRLEKKRQQA